MDKTSNVTNYILNLLGDAQTSSISYFKFRSYILKPPIVDVILNPLEAEYNKRLTKKMKNFT